MKLALRTLIAALGFAGAALAVQAQQLPAGAPAGTTVQCKDGSFAAPDKKAGACRGHKGIQTWYGPAGGAATPAPAAAPAAPAAPMAAAPAAAAPAAPMTKAGKTDLSKMAAAPGGGAGKVWVNDTSNVYHCMGDRYYGKTKKGEYMTEADAKAKGAKPSGGKACAA